MTRVGEPYPAGAYAPGVEQFDDPGRSPHLADLEAHTRQHAANFGLDPRHAAFAPWDRWSPTPAPMGELPVAGVRVGEIVIEGSRSRTPFFMPNLGAGHTSLPEAGWSVPLARMQLTRILGSVPAGAVVIDEFDLKGEFNEFTELEQAGLLEHIPHGRLEAKITQLANLQRDILTGRRATIGTIRDPWWHLLLINGRPELSKDAWDKLAYLVQSGTQWGKLLAIGADVPESKLVQRGIPGSDLVRQREGGEVSYTLDPQVPPALIRRTVSGITAYATKDRGKPFSINEVDEGPLWGETLADGLTVLLGRDKRTGQFITKKLGGDTCHWFIEGRTGTGKSFAIRDIICSLAKKYGPNQLEIYCIDGGPSAAVFGPGLDDDTYLPHLKLLAANMRDPEYGMAVLEHLQGVLREREDILKRYRADSIETVRKRYPDVQVPSVLLVWDEIQRLLGDEEWADQAVTILEDLLVTGRKCDIHVIAATPNMTGVSKLWNKDNARLQFGVRIAFKGSEDVMNLKEHESLYGQLKLNGDAWVNDNGGSGPAEHDSILRFAHASDEEVEAIKRRMPRAAGVRPMVFDGTARPRLEESAHFRNLTPGSGRTVEAVVGQEFSIHERPATIDLGDEFGRNLVVLGNRYAREATRVMRNAVLSLAKQHEPDAAYFSLVCCDSKQQDAARDLVRELQRAGQRVQLIDGRKARDFVEAVAQELHEMSPSMRHFMVMFGADRMPGTAAEHFKAVVAQGPERGTHVLASAGSMTQLKRALGGYGSDPLELFEGRVVVDAPQDDIRDIAGFRYDWLPHNRPGRVLVGEERGEAKVVITYQ